MVIMWKGGQMTTMSVTPRTNIVGAGYEGRDIATFVQDLVRSGVSLLVDVRLTPISRKPGFSKNALRQALSESGIAYEHRPALGNPKDNRAGFAGSAQELEHARAVYSVRLRDARAQEALADLADAAARERVAVLCFEADQRRCHRDLVLDAVSVWGSTRPER